MVTVYDFIGMIGVAFAIAGYTASQFRIIRSDMWQFPAANLVCCTLVGVSLIDKWNLPSFVLQLMYAIVSSYGLVRCWRGR